jgi:O-antigen ligase
VERASRLLVLVSLALAAASHVFLLNHAVIRGAAGVTAAAMFLLARISLPTALIVLTSATFVAPALLASVITGGDYHQIVVWLAGAVGVLLARLDTSRWHVPHGWMAPLATWAMIVAVTWPVVAAREVDFSIAAVRASYPATPLTDAPPAFAAAFVALVALTQLVGILWLDLLYMNYRARPRELSRAVLLPLIASAVVGSCAAVYQRYGDLTWMNLHIWSNMQRAGGLMNDANAFGTSAALLAPAAIALAWFTGRGMTAAIAAMLVLALGMWSTGSRTALLVFAFGTGAVAFAGLRDRGLWNPRIARVAAALAAVIFVTAAALVPRDYESSNPLERAFARVPPFDRTEIARFANELWARFGYGTAAHQMIVEHPLSGVGVGAFPVVAPEYFYPETGRVLAADNAQNWWRHQLAELGVVGAMPALWFSVVIAALCLRNTPERPATVLRGAIGGLGIVSLLGVPTQHAAVTLTAATVLAWFGINAPEPVTRQVPSRTTWAAASLVLIFVVTISSTWTAFGSLRAPLRALRAGVPYTYGLMPAQEVSRYGELRWMAANAVLVVKVSQPWLRLTFVPPDAELSRRPLRVQVRTGTGENLTRDLTEPSPVSVFVQMPRTPMVMLELQASHELLPSRALQLAISSHDALPPDVRDVDILRAPSRQQ